MHLFSFCARVLAIQSSSWQLAPSVLLEYDPADILMGSAEILKVRGLKSREMYRRHLFTLCSSDYSFMHLGSWCRLK